MVAVAGPVPKRRLLSSSFVKNQPGGVPLKFSMYFSISSCSPEVLLKLSPEVNGEIVGAHVQGRVVWNLNEISSAIEDKCTINEARPSGRIVAQQGVPAADDVVGIPIPWPPARHVRRWLNADLCPYGADCDEEVEKDKSPTK